MINQSKNPIQEFIDEDKRIEKWIEIIQNWDKIMKKQRYLIKIGVRNGIPDLIRGNVWQYLIGSNSRSANESLETYLEYLEAPTCEYENLIVNDIQRTFPKHPLFNSYTAEGQTSLYNILRVFANKNKDVGYCQGMGFISAVLLTYMDEESSFWLLDYVVKKNHLQGYFTHSMSSLNSAFYKLQALIKRFIPRVHSHFINYRIQPSMYASQWFLTLFAINFPFEILERIWDIYLLEGEKTIYRFGVAILVLHEDELLAEDFEKVMDSLKKMYKDVDANKLISTALNLKITNSILQNLHVEFSDTPDQEIKEFLMF